MAGKLTGAVNVYIQEHAGHSDYISTAYLASPEQNRQRGLRNDIQRWITVGASLELTGVYVRTWSTPDNSDMPRTQAILRGRSPAGWTAGTINCVYILSADEAADIRAEYAAVMAARASLAPEPAGEIPGAHTRKPDPPTGGHAEENENDDIDPTEGPGGRDVRGSRERDRVHLQQKP